MADYLLMTDGDRRAVNGWGGLNVVMHSILWTVTQDLSLPDLLRRRFFTAPLQKKDVCRRYRTWQCTCNSFTPHRIFTYIYVSLCNIVYTCMCFLTDNNVVISHVSMSLKRNYQQKCFDDNETWNNEIGVYVAVIVPLSASLLLWTFVMIHSH